MTVIYGPKMALLRLRHLRVIRLAFPSHSVCTWMYLRCLSKKSPLLTPIFPKVLVLPTSGRMQARFFRCSGNRIQSSQYDRGLKKVGSVFIYSTNNLHTSSWASNSRHPLYWMYSTLWIMWPVTTAVVLSTSRVGIKGLIEDIQIPERTVMPEQEDASQNVASLNSYAGKGFYSRDIS